MAVEKEKWVKQYEFYHKFYSDIPQLTSLQLISSYDIGFNAEANDQGERKDALRELSPVVLIDVRSKPERDVSIIPTAITLNDYENGIKSGAISLETDVVTYCTVGYRSGMEAQNIRQTYGTRVYSLDGIVAYTHTKGCKLIVSNEKGNCETKDVHTFASFWGDVDGSYVAKSFGPISYFYRSFEVIARASVLFIQKICLRCCKNN